MTLVGLSRVLSGDCEVEHGVSFDDVTALGDDRHGTPPEAKELGGDVSDR